MNGPTFNKGDRVRYSSAGLARLPVPQRSGAVSRQSKERIVQMVSVLWDGTVIYDYVLVEFLEKTGEQAAGAGGAR